MKSKRGPASTKPLLDDADVLVLDVVELALDVELVLVLEVEPLLDVEPLLEVEPLLDDDPSLVDEVLEPPPMPLLEVVLEVEAPPVPLLEDVVPLAISESKSGRQPPNDAIVPSVPLQRPTMQATKSEPLVP